MNKEIEVSYYTIDNKDYIIVKEAIFEGKDYVYLANENDEDDIMVRRVNGDTLELLDSTSELNKVLKVLIG